MRMGGISFFRVEVLRTPPATKQRAAAHKSSGGMQFFLRDGLEQFKRWFVEFGVRWGEFDRVANFNRDANLAVSWCPCGRASGSFIRRLGA
jgi:hypothetical protein